MAECMSDVSEADIQAMIDLFAAIETDTSANAVERSMAYSKLVLATATFGQVVFGS